MRRILVVRFWSWFLASIVAQVGVAANPLGAQGIADYAAVQLNDTSFIHRYVALDRLQRASPQVRRNAAAQFAAALRDSSRTVRQRALGGLYALGPDASGAVAAVVGMVTTRDEPLRPNAIRTLGGIKAPQTVSTLVDIVRDRQDPQRAVAIGALGSMGGVGAPGIAAIRDATRDPNEGIQMAAAGALMQLGDTASARAAFRSLLQSAADERRFAAARTLASISDPSAVLVLKTFLTDSSFLRRTQAASALGAEGPKAATAIPALIAMLGDTTMSRVRDGTAWTDESAAPYAAWALSKIIPFRATGMTGYGGEALRARVEGASNSLRGDGLGWYSWGSDSAAVFRGAPFVIMLASNGAPRGPYGPETHSLRRSFSFDLSKALPNSGSRPLGVIKDDEAQIHIWYKRDFGTSQIISFQTLDVSDSVHAVERIEMHFRVNGVLHELQMGPFVEGQGGGGPFYTGVNGRGTTLGEFVHPVENVWMVRAGPSSIARLWSFEDPARPIDRGLYAFSLQIRFTTFPGGPNQSCVPDPAKCSP